MTAMAPTKLADAYDVIVIGAGPAGLAAASATANAGLATLLLDENPGPGGQVYRAITATPVTDPSILGPDYWRGRALVENARDSGATLVQGASVFSLDRDLVVGVSRQGAAGLVRARHVIVATGALERPFPIPGWTLPGVMTVGGAQTLLKASGLYPQGKTVIAGMGPLIWAYAAQVLRAGGDIAAILDTTPSGSARRTWRYAAGFLFSALPAKGLALIREVTAKVKIVRHVTELAAEGTDRVRAVSFATAHRAPTRLAVDTLLLHQGVVPNVNLAISAGVAHTWHPRQLCWVPALDTDGNTSIPGLAIAGDGAGIAGAWAAEERGRIAAHAAIRRLRPEMPFPDDQGTRRRLARHERPRAFLDALYQPPRQFRLPVADTVVCRCEEVTAVQVRATAALGCAGPNQMKAFLRCGMGPCQGRLCGLTVTELIAEVRGTSPADVGYYRLRPPVKPITLAELAALPANEAARQAVVRD